MQINIPETVYVESSFARTIGADDQHSSRIAPMKLRKSGYIVGAGSSVEFPVDSTVTVDSISNLSVSYLGLTAQIFSTDEGKWIRLTNSNKNHAVRIHAGQSLVYGN